MALLDTYHSLTNTVIFISHLRDSIKDKGEKSSPTEAAEICSFVWNSAELFLMLVIAVLKELEEF